jgi:hypothetical protein
MLSSSFYSALRLIKMAENTNIKVVLDYQFFMRLLHDKLRTGNKSRPTPLLKGKAIPLQALTGPEGSRRLRLPDFKTIGT